MVQYYNDLSHCDAIIFTLCACARGKVIGSVVVVVSVIVIVVSVIVVVVSIKISKSQKVGT